MARRQLHEPETGPRYALRLARTIAVDVLAVAAALFAALFLLGYIHP